MSEERKNSALFLAPPSETLVGMCAAAVFTR